MQQLDSERPHVWAACGLGERHRSSMVREPSGPWGDALSRATARIGKGGIIALTGGRGTGKTQMAAHMILSAIKSFVPKTGLAWPRYCRAMGFYLDIRATFRREASTTERDALMLYTRPTMLVIDELHERGETPWEDRLLTHIIDCRYADMRDTILISNQTPEEMMRQVGPSIADRLRETGGVIECAWPSFRGA